MSDGPPFPTVDPEFDAEVAMTIAALLTTGLPAEPRQGDPALTNLTMKIIDDDVLAFGVITAFIGAIGGILGFDRARELAQFIANDPPPTGLSRPIVTEAIAEYRQ